MTRARWGTLGLAFLAMVACRTPQAHEQPTATMAQAKSAVDVVQAQLDAYNAQDLDAFMATYADDIVVTSLSQNAVLVEGKEALRARYAGLFHKYPKNHCRIAERRTEGDNVVLDHEIITGRAPEKPDPWDAGWVRYEVEGGLIKHVHLP